jgi:hypothetical protein
MNHPDRSTQNTSRQILERVSYAGLHGTLDRCALLCGLIAKVEPRETVRKASRAGQSPRHPATHRHVDERFARLC